MNPILNIIEHQCFQKLLENSANVENVIFHTLSFDLQYFEHYLIRAIFSTVDYGKEDDSKTRS